MTYYLLAELDAGELGERVTSTDMTREGAHAMGGGVGACGCVAPIAMCNGCVLVASCQCADKATIRALWDHEG